MFNKSLSKIFDNKKSEIKSRSISTISPCIRYEGSSQNEENI